MILQCRPPTCVPHPRQTLEPTQSPQRADYQSRKTSGSASYPVPHASAGSSRNYGATDDADEYESEHETLMRHLFGATSSDRI